MNRVSNTIGTAQDITKNNQKVEKEMQEKVQDLIRGRSRIKVLEAGCGTRTYFSFGCEVELYGIDISSEELAKNSYIHHKILRNFPLFCPVYFPEEQGRLSKVRE